MQHGHSGLSLSFSSQSLGSTFMHIYLPSHLLYTQKLKPQVGFYLNTKMHVISKIVCQKPLVTQPTSIFHFFLHNRIPIFFRVPNTIFAVSFSYSYSDHLMNSFQMRQRQKLLGTHLGRILKRETVGQDQHFCLHPAPCLEHRSDNWCSSSYVIYF